jgi:hypothetical protein
MELFYFTPITRKRVRVSVAGVLADGAAATLDDVDVALLPLRGVPDGDTAFENITMTDGVISPLIAAFDAENQTDVLPLPAEGAKLWLKVVDGDEVDAVPVAEFRVMADG